MDVRTTRPQAIEADANRGALGDPARPIHDFLRFLRDPAARMPAGFSRATLAGTGRLYLLDLALMAALMMLALLVVGLGVEIPENSLAELEFTPLILVGIVIAAPVLEELAFRLWLSGRPGQLLCGVALALAFFGLPVLVGVNPALPIITGGLVVIALGGWLFLRKHGPVAGWPSAFPAAFYASAVIFGLVHVFNYPGSDWWTVLPLVLPQTLAGLIFGYARVSYGMWSAILLHMLHNGTAMLLVLTGMAFESEAVEDASEVAPVSALSVSAAAF